MKARSPHGLRNVDAYPEDWDWACFCGLVCVDSPDPESVWIAHVTGLALGAPTLDRGEVQFLTLDCGCELRASWPSFDKVARITGTVFYCPNHRTGFCFHADVGVDGLPYYRRSDCSAVELSEME